MGFFEKMQGFVENKFAPIANKVSNQRHVTAIKKGLITTLPLTIIGGVALILAVPPVDTEIIQPTNFFNRFLLMWKSWATANNSMLMTPYNLSLGLLGLFVVIGVSYFLSEKYEINKISGVITSLFTFLVVAAPTQADNPAGFISSNYLDAKGMFSGIIIAIITVEITKFLLEKNIKIKMPDEVPPMVAAPFEALIPIIVNVVVFMSLNSLVLSLLNMSIPEISLKIFEPIVIASNTLPGVLLVIIVINFLWFFGIHGGAVANSVIVPIITANVAANAEAVAQGAAMPYIFSGRFVNLFANLGGSGAALSLALAMIIVAKSSHLKSVSKVGLVPAFFGISEPLVFSTPMIMNPMIFFPMVFVPIINASITYFTMSTGLVGKIYVNVPFTTPGPFGSFLSTMDWRAAVLWFVLITIDVIIYMPFVKGYDKQMLEEEQVSEVEAA
ncbi:PTS system cellobiose-specific IIC component [Halanaerobium saccharolyticum]|uniref:Permease IIC component n=1 Tax=Halanaerobium saccharolyticum TaxID=43595 RepID=A0A4R7Z997_9FIRM|nr:PTS transporter subunit EIIC [Halanaerobium saccharolyticum]RAK11720.1 PTS system cellobiose-specific IIC component [Halanaerobium saccharolyticum]TDW07561.1 PTS system cellobiose-specific IIC component [Halanaerobium saccharolyticum]TDX64482.1 PTS system cellobiose-specific IIC component [Halanaerobium saccharolyticum]